MQFAPYLNFNGNCAEAFAFYKDLFKGQIVHQSTFGEMPPDDKMPPLPPEAKDGIMHVHLQVGEQALMGSDAMPGAGEACVRVLASTVNPSDVVTVAGSDGTRTAFPRVPGFDGVGVIEAV